MGAILEDLDDHEGYALWRLADGPVVPAWAPGVREFAAYVAGCGCGWRGAGEHPPTEAGEDLAVQEWDTEHATPLLERQATRHRTELAQVLRALGGIADFIENPTNLPRIARAVDRARDLVAEVQRDLDRQPPEREAEHER